MTDQRSRADRATAPRGDVCRAGVPDVRNGTAVGTTIGVDAVFAAIRASLARSRTGSRDDARSELETLWGRVGHDGPSTHRAVLAHALAELSEDPGSSLEWNRVALWAIELDDGRAPRVVADRGDVDLPSGIAEFVTALHIEIAEDLHHLGHAVAARTHLAAAERSMAELSDETRPTSAAAVDRLRTALGSLTDR